MSTRTVVSGSVIVISDLGLCHWEESSKSDVEGLMNLFCPIYL